MGELSSSPHPLNCWSLIGLTKALTDMNTKIYANKFFLKNQEKNWLTRLGGYLSTIYGVGHY